MTKELKQGLIAAFTNQPSANFSQEEVNEAAVNAIRKELGLSENASSREFRAVEAAAFALIEEAVDEILPARVQARVGQFCETRSFARDAEVIFDIEKVGKKRAKLTISKGARGGIYRAARVSDKYFSLGVDVYTAAVYVTLEEILLGTMSLGELFTNILEGFEEIIYKETFNALATGVSAANNGSGTRYDRNVGNATSGSGNHNYDSYKNILTTKATIDGALDIVIPYVKSYGTPTIFGSYQALTNIFNPLANTTAVAGYPNNQDSLDVRNVGFVQVYKGVNVVELPNYIYDIGDTSFFYDLAYIFVIPAGAKPVKVAFKGDMYIKRNPDALGGEKWEAHKMMGVGVAMANNYAVIKVTDL